MSRFVSSRRSHRRSRRSHDDSRDAGDGDSFVNSPRWLAIRLLVILACSITFYILFKVAFAGNATPRTISIMAPFVPLFFTCYFVMTRPFRPTVFFIGLFFQVGAFIFLVHLRQRAFDDTSFDWAVNLQLFTIATGGIWALFNIRRLIAQWSWNDPAVLVLIAFLFLAGLSLIGSPNPSYGATSLATLGVFIAISAAMALHLRSGEFQSMIVFALFPPVVLSLISYLSQSELTFAWGMTSDYSVIRLRGVAGAPVGLAHQCWVLILACLARVVTAKRNRAAWIMFSLAAIPLAIWVSALSESRSPPAAAALALIMVSIIYFKPFGRHSVLISIVAGLVALPIGYFLIDQGLTDSVLAGLSRSGQAKEISTLTGRLELWQVVFKMIAEKPFLGYGIGSGVALLPAAFEGTDLHVVHTHNLAIHTAFSIGIAGSILLTILIIFVVVRSYVANDLFIMVIFAFMILTNITETSILANKPSFTTFLFVAATCRMIAGSHQQKRRRTSGSSDSKKPHESRYRRRSSAVKLAKRAPVTAL